jgi:leucyl aminopeptidase (aminopeptidase T)
MTNTKTHSNDMHDTIDDELRTNARQILEQNLGAREGEDLVVVTDAPKRTIGQALFEAGLDLDLEAGFIEMRPRRRSGMEPPEYVTAAMETADLVVCPTSTSLTHTRAREQAVAAGARVATMPGVIPAMFRGGAISADYSVVERLTVSVAEKLTAAEEARIEASNETFTVSLDGRNGIPSDGILQEAGTSGNLPSGEGYIAPLEDTGQGTLVFDGGIVGSGTVDDPLVVEIEDGDIVNAHGEPAESFLERTNGERCARRVCELGIGTNPAASIIGNVLEDEKVYGTCHVAFGDNHGFDGTIECDSHIDGIVRKPDVYLDDKRIVSGGELTL